LISPQWQTGFFRQHLLSSGVGFLNDQGIGAGAISGQRQVGKDLQSKLSKKTTDNYPKRTLTSLF
jgi:hypothetical protein